MSSTTLLLHLLSLVLSSALRWRAAPSSPEGSVFLSAERAPA